MEIIKVQFATKESITTETEWKDVGMCNEDLLILEPYNPDEFEYYKRLGNRYYFRNRDLHFSVVIAELKYKLRFREKYLLKIE